MELDERLMCYEEQEETLGDIDGALLIREARERIAQLEERVRELETENKQLKERLYTWPPQEDSPLQFIPREI